MQLYLIRHAEAEDLGVGGITRDFDRPLTERGCADSRALAIAFHRMGISLDAVVASPLVRAHQTAVELLAVLAPDYRVVTCDLLALDQFKPKKLSQFLWSLPVGGERVPTREAKSIAAVGHMPDLGEYLEWLIGSVPGSIRFAKGGAALVTQKGEPARGEGRLEWLSTPDWFG